MPGAPRHGTWLEPIEASLHVNETVIFQNEAKTTFNHPDNGTLRVFLPEQMQGKPRVMVTAPQGMPVEREAAETGEANVYKIDFPIKPGETRFDLTYVLPAPESGVFAGKVLDGNALYKDFANCICRNKIVVQIDNPEKCYLLPSSPKEGAFRNWWGSWGCHQVVFYGDLRQKIRGLAALLGFEVVEGK